MSYIVMELPTVIYENSEEVDKYNADPIEGELMRTFIIPLNELIRINKYTDQTSYLFYGDDLFEISMTYDELKKELHKALKSELLYKFNQ